MKPIYSCYVPGRPPSKKNTKKVYRRFGKTMVVYTKLFLAWEQTALVYMKQAMINRKLIDKPIEAKFIFEFKNHKAEPDTSNLIEAPQDALTKAGVISDDKIIQVVHAKKTFGDGEGTVIELYEIE